MKVSSTKSMTGHLLGGAAAVEAIACVMAIREGIVRRLSATRSAIRSAIWISLRTRRLRCRVNVAISNSLGFGGHNACILIQEGINNGHQRMKDIALELMDALAAKKLGEVRARGWDDAKIKIKRSNRLP